MTLSVSSAFSRPYSITTNTPIDSTQRSGTIEALSREAIAEQVKQHTSGGHEEGHAGGHESGQGNETISKAALALGVNHKKVKKTPSQKEASHTPEKEDDLAKIEKDPILNRLMSQVFLNEKNESTIEFLQGSTLNTMGHFSEGFTLGAVLAGLFHTQKIVNSEKENGQLIPGQIIAGRGKDGHFYRIAYTKNGKNSFWEGSTKNPNNESLQILRSKHKGQQLHKRIENYSISDRHKWST